MDDDACLDENTLVELAERRLADGPSDRVEAHLRRCALCRKALAALAASDTTDAPDATDATDATDAPDASDATGAAPLPEAPPVLTRGANLGRYVVLDLIGAGAMGAVYSAYDTTLDRRVALKFVHEPTGDRHARLVREAKVLAQLSHPNVVTVFDVGEREGRPFIAMELVAGETLTEWLRAPRGWRAVRDAFLHAGRGLSAAHAAGVLHRDFKPDNVLVGADGRVRVTDFGLARPAHLRASEGEAPAKNPALTATGAVVGTPAYMAPELLAAGAASEASDQYAFCVALYQGLYQERPFAGETAAKIAAAAAAGEVRAARAGASVPPWLRQVVLRGLHPDPKARYASVDSLLEALERDPSIRRRWRVFGALAIVTVAAVAIGSYRAGGGQVGMCQGAEQRLSGVWDAERKQAVREAFARTGVPYAEDTFRRVEEALDAHASTWIKAHEQACLATRSRHEYSEQILDLRMSCLDQRLKEMDALTALFAAANATTVERAVQASGALTSVAMCADVEALASTTKLPADPAARARVEELRAELAQVKAQLDVGDVARGLEVAQRAADKAGRLGFRPAEAEALWLRGAFERWEGQYERAEESLHTAIWAAVAGRDSRSLVLAAADLVITASERARFDAARDAARHGWAALEALGGDSDLEARLLSAEGKALLKEGKFAESLERHRRALALREQRFGPQDLSVAYSLGNIGEILETLSRHEEALAYTDRALAVQEAAVGSEHPDIAARFNTRATALYHLGKHDEALAAYQRSLAITEKAFGPDHDRVAVVLNNLGNFYHAIEGDDDKALPLLQRALAIAEKAFGPEHPRISDPVLNLGDVERTLGHYPEALAHYRRALAIDEKAYGASHPYVAADLIGLGRALIESGTPADALAPLERALSLLGKDPVDAENLAEARFALARALWDTGRDRHRAIDLGERALEGSTGTGKLARRERAAVEAWLTAPERHRLRGARR